MIGQIGVRRTREFLRASSSPRRFGPDPRITIPASGVKGRINRPDTSPHSITKPSVQIFLANRAASTQEARSQRHLGEGRRRRADVSHRRLTTGRLAESAARSARAASQCCLTLRILPLSVATCAASHRPAAMRRRTCERCPSGDLGRFARCRLWLQKRQAATMFSGVSAPPSDRGRRCSAVHRRVFGCRTRRHSAGGQSLTASSHIGRSQ